MVVGQRRRPCGEPRAPFARVIARWSLTLGVVVGPGHDDSRLDPAGYAAVLHEVGGDG